MDQDLSVRCAERPVHQQTLYFYASGTNLSDHLERILSFHRRDQYRRSQRTQLDSEILWSFHSSFFYLGVRKYVYQLSVPDDIESLVDARVNAFLDGAAKQFTDRRLKGGRRMPPEGILDPLAEAGLLEAVRAPVNPSRGPQKEEGLTSPEAIRFDRDR